MLPLSARQTRHMKKTELDYFRKRVRYWQQRLGLCHFRVWVDAASLPDENGAQVHFGESAAKITINSDRKATRKHMDKSAFHECMHLCIGDLEMLAKDRFVSEQEIDREVERVVVRIESAFYGTELI